MVIESIDGARLSALLRSLAIEIAVRCADTIDDPGEVFRVGTVDPRSLSGTLGIKYARALRLGFDIRGLEEFVQALERTEDAEVGLVRAPAEGPDFFSVVLNRSGTCVIAVLEAHGSESRE